jgi:hypothetical protein
VTAGSSVKTPASARAGPLIAYARIERLDLLRQVVGELLIPEAVYEEMTRVRRRPGAADVERGDWIRQRVVRSQAAIATLPPTLHGGERQAIVLAEELEARLLIDERRGRALAAGRELITSMTTHNSKPPCAPSKATPAQRQQGHKGQHFPVAFIHLIHLLHMITMKKQNGLRP